MYIENHVHMKQEHNIEDKGPENMKRNRDKLDKKRINSINLWIGICQGIGIKGREMTLVWHEKASRTALQTSSV